MGKDGPPICNSRNGGIGYERGRYRCLQWEKHGFVSPILWRWVLRYVHTASELPKNLDSETRGVPEHTGRYFASVAQLYDAEMFVRGMNPRLTKDYGNNSLRRVKTDKNDSRKSTRYRLNNWGELCQHTPTDTICYQLKAMNRLYGLYS